MDDLRIFARTIGYGQYQVFIQNVGYPCDFIRIATGFSIRHEKPPVRHINRRWILTPFKPGNEPIHIDDFTVEDLKSLQVWYAVDTCLRKPSRKIGGYISTIPGAAKLRVTVGADTDIAIKKRDDSLELKDFIESYRLNVKDRIQELLKRYVHNLNHASSEEFQYAINNGKRIGEVHLKELGLLDFSRVYNSGATFQEMRASQGERAETYYEWFVHDFELPVPTGHPPAAPIKLDIPQDDTNEEVKP